MYYHMHVTPRSNTLEQSSESEATKDLQNPAYCEYEQLYNVLEAQDDVSSGSDRQQKDIPEHYSTIGPAYESIRCSKFRVVPSPNLDTTSSNGTTAGKKKRRIQLRHTEPVGRSRNNYYDLVTSDHEHGYARLVQH